MVSCDLIPSTNPKYKKIDRKPSKTRNFQPSNPRFSTRNFQPSHPPWLVIRATRGTDFFRGGELVLWLASVVLCSGLDTPDGVLAEARVDFRMQYGGGSKPWYSRQYLVNPKIAGKWMFIPLKMYL